MQGYEFYHKHLSSMDNFLAYHVICEDHTQKNLGNGSCQTIDSSFHIVWYHVKILWKELKRFNWLHTKGIHLDVRMVCGDVWKGRCLGHSKFLVASGLFANEPKVMDYMFQCVEGEGLLDPCLGQAPRPCDQLLDQWCIQRDR